MREWKEKEILGIKACASFFSIKEEASFSTFFPKSLQGTLSQVAPSLLKPENFLVPCERFIKNIHPSWLLEPLETFPSVLKEELIACLPNPIKDQLSPKKRVPSSPYFAPLLLKQLVNKVWNENVFLETMLPENPLNSLLKKREEDLLEIIDYLGTIEFAYEIKTILDSKVLEQLQKCFSDKQWRYIKQVPQSRPRSKKESLLKGVQTKRELQKKILSEGLRNFSLSFTEEDKDLIWHLIRKFPKEIGLDLEAFIKEPRQEHSRVLWKKELENFLKRKERS